jgi:hypothetical protein
MGGLEVKELSADKAQVKEEAGVDEDAGLVHVDSTTVIFEESLGRGTVHVELDRF